MKRSNEHIEIGKTGEEIACNFLISKGFSIVSRNFRTKFGEIDIVAKNKNVIHFVEVKSVSYEPLDQKSVFDMFQPEENVTKWKLEKLQKTIEIYLNKPDNGGLDSEWGIDVLTVKIDKKSMKARVKFIENISFE